MEEKKETFEYNYSAKQQKEIKTIREKYVPKEENKMEQLWRLDASATKPGTAASIIVGVIGALLFGIGMCCTMVWMGNLFIPGIVIGVAGLLAIAAAYPVYTHITKKTEGEAGPGDHETNG